MVCSTAQTNRWMLASRENSYFTRLLNRPHTRPHTLRQSVKHSLWLECVFQRVCERGSHGEEKFEGNGELKKRVNVSINCAHR